MTAARSAEPSPVSTASCSVVEGIYSGTQTGPLVGPAGTLPVSGNAFAFPYVDIFRVADGKVVSHRIYWDNLGFMSQLGALAS